MIADAVVSALLLFSGFTVLSAGLGLARLPDFFLRMHAPSLAYTLGSWSVTIASIVHFTAAGEPISLHVWIIIILLSITAPITTLLLARAGLFRGRQAGEPLPRPLADAAAEQPDGSGAGKVTTPPGRAPG